MTTETIGLLVVVALAVWYMWDDTNDSRHA